MRNLRAQIHRLVEPVGARSFIDLGCGKGEDLLAIRSLVPSDCQLVGVDTSDASLDQARKAAGADSRCRFMNHDLLQRFPFGDGEFDRILSVNVLETIPDKQGFLQEVHRILAKDGRVVLAHVDWDSQLFDGEDIWHGWTTRENADEYERRLWRYGDRVDAATGRTGIGAIQHCYTGESVTVEKVVDWRPFEQFTLDCEWPLGARFRVTTERRCRDNVETLRTWVAAIVATQDQREPARGPSTARALPIVHARAPEGDAGC